MKKTASLVAAALFAAAATTAHAATFYVSKSGNNTNDGKSWAKAKLDIQAAIQHPDLRAGDLILVESGEFSEAVYGYIDITQISNSVNRAITIMSTRGWEYTKIKGETGRRCATLGASATDTQTVLIGFLLSEGNPTDGKGGASFGGKLEECVLQNNQATEGGGAHGGILYNCVLVKNTATAKGGGAYASQMQNCSLIENTTSESAANSEGGGAWGGTLNHCYLEMNQAFSTGGPGAAARTTAR